MKKKRAMKYSSEGITKRKRKQKPSPMIADKKIQRNDPCHCGSGKKFKKCHLNPSE